MDYQFSPEELKLQQDVAEVCKARIAPRALTLDQCSRNEACLAMKENLKALAAGGCLEPGHTGDGFDMVSLYLAGEEIAKACPATFLSARASTFLCAGALRLFGTPAQKEKHLPALMRADSIGAFAYSEDLAGTDMGAITTSARRVGDTWLLTGGKNLVVNAPIADIFLVLAYHDAEAGKDKGMGLFIVEKGAEGLQVGPCVETLGLRGVPVAPVILDACVSGGVLGKASGNGYEQTGRMLSLGTIGVAALCVGIGMACMEVSTSHAKNRTAFGKRIGMFQDVGFKLADMFAYNDLGRMLALRAAWAMNGGEPDAGELAACAKLFASEGAVKIVNWGMQIHGGHGFLSGCGIEKLYRDARFGEICEGTSEMQRMLISRIELDRFLQAQT